MHTTGGAALLPPFGTVIGEVGLTTLLLVLLTVPALLELFEPDVVGVCHLLPNQRLVFLEGDELLVPRYQPDLLFVEDVGLFRVIFLRRAVFGSRIQHYLMVLHSFLLHLVQKFPDCFRLVWPKVDDVVAGVALLVAFFVVHVVAFQEAEGRVVVVEFIRAGDVLVLFVETQTGGNVSLFV